MPEMRKGLRTPCTSASGIQKIFRQITSRE